MAGNPYAPPRAELGPAPAAASRPRLFSWNARIGRVRLFVYSLAALLLAMAGIVVVGDVIRPRAAPDSRAVFLLDLAFWLSMPLAVGTAVRRRLHDFDVSGWWALLLFFPIMQLVFLLYLLLAPGTPHGNRYGAPPAPNGAGLLGGAVLGGLLVGWLTARRFL